MALLWPKLCSIFLAFQATYGIECQECLTTNADNTESFLSLAFNVDQLTVTTDCKQGSDKTQTCEHACVVAMISNDKEDMALRGCADTLITASQWTSLQMTAEEAPETCKESYLGSTDGKASTGTKLCFCKTDKCNNQLWEDIKEKKAGQSVAATLGLVLTGVISHFMIH